VMMMMNMGTMPAVMEIEASTDSSVVRRLMLGK
jgi:hypothetical protein